MFASSVFYHPNLQHTSLWRVGVGWMAETSAGFISAPRKFCRKDLKRVYSPSAVDISTPRRIDFIYALFWLRESVIFHSPRLVKSLILCRRKVMECPAHLVQNIYSHDQEGQVIERSGVLSTWFSAALPSTAFTCLISVTSCAKALDGIVIIFFLNAEMLVKHHRVVISADWCVVEAIPMKQQFTNLYFEELLDRWRAPIE